MIDWNSIEGYRDDMSADEKLALLDNYTPPAAPTDPAAEEATKPAEPKSTPKSAPELTLTPKPGYISKREYDKVSSQLADAKRQLRSKMSEEEQREADRQAEIAAREDELKTLRREKTQSNYKASFMGLGLDESLSADAATALVDGDSDSLFDVLKRYQVGYEKSMRAKILAETPKPPAGLDPNSDESKKQDQEKLRRYFGLTH